MEPSACQATYLLGLSKPHALQEQSVARKSSGEGSHSEHLCARAGPFTITLLARPTPELPLPTLPISEGLFSILLCGPCQLLILLVLLWLTDKLTFCNVNTITTPKSELCTLIDHLTINKQSHLNPYPCHLRWVNLLLQGQQPLRLNPVVYAVACWK